MTKQQQPIDVAISGQGFYAIHGETARGRRFLRRVEGESYGTAYCDDTRLTRAIADGAAQAGLRVVVNGTDYEQRTDTGDRP